MRRDTLQRSGATRWRRWVAGLALALFGAIIEDDPKNPRYIVGIRGVGYRFAG